MNKQEFSGKTLDEALINAARTLGTEVSLLSYNILPQASGGLLSKLFQRGVRLEAWVDSSNDVQAAAREAVRQAMSGSQSTGPESRHGTGTDEARNNPRQQRTPRNERGDKNNRRPQRTNGAVDAGPKPRAARHERGNDARPLGQPVAQEEGTERIARPRSLLTSDESKQLLTELGEKFVAGFDPSANPATTLNFLSDEEVVVSVNSQSLEETLIRSDRLSCAFEHLFKRIAQKRFGDVSGRVIFNSGNALELREEKLKEMALSVAAKVKESGKTVTLSSKSSQERRVIHLALENMEGIGTKSIGVGDSRKLIVFSTDKAHRKAQNSRRRQQQRSRNSNQGEAALSGAELANGTPEEGNQQSRRPSRRRGRRGGNAHRPQHNNSPQFDGNQHEQEPDSRDQTQEV